MSIESQEIPQDLHQLNYARRILDDLGLPAKGNLELVADCIEALSKQKRWPLHEAYQLISDKALLAQRRGQKVDRWWFQNGDYNIVEPKTGVFKGTFVPIDKKRTEEEQSSPEWQEANDKLRKLVKDIADGKYPPKPIRRNAQEEQEKLSAFLRERKSAGTPTA